jgi:hypothetical protein
MYIMNLAAMMSAILDIFDKHRTLNKHLFLLSDVCHPSPCVNGGSCQTVNDNEYHCQCLPGFYGGNCQLGKANSGM